MIRRLPPEIVREIAAGEVVFSVADVVRELLENALDAGASRVRVELWGGGLDRIVVQDNGVGIPLEELSLAVEPHATSKLERLDQITLSIASGNSQDPHVTAAAMRTVHEMLVILETRHNTA